MNKKILVTGTGSGLGKELVNVFEENNMFVIPHTHSEMNNSCVFGDISDDRVRKEITKSFVANDCNILINNVGIYQYNSFHNMSDDQIIKLINTNLTSTILLTKSILDHILELGEGMIYNINSLAGINPAKYESVYCASKFGLRGFTESLIQEYRNHKNIKIVNVTLGAFKSKITESRSNFDELAEPREVAEKICSHINEEYNTIKSELIIYRN